MRYSSYIWILINALERMLTSLYNRNTLGINTQCKIRQCSKCHSDTEFYCITCKHDLCLQCKQEHATYSANKYHKLVFYRTRYCERSTASTCKVRQCPQCRGDTEFHCNTCNRDLCLQCKERHLTDIDTKIHDVVIYREKYKYVLKQEVCVTHQDRTYKKYCHSCELPICYQCSIHKNHEILDIKRVYITKRQQHREVIHNIRSKIPFNNFFLLAEIKTDLNICHKKISKTKSKMFAKASRIKDIIDTLNYDVKTMHKRSLIFRHKQLIKNMKKYLPSIEFYKHRLEQSQYRPVEFLSFLKKNNVPIIKVTPFRIQDTLLTLTGEIHTKDILRLLCEVHIVETTKRQVGNECLLKLMSSPVLQRSVSLTGITTVSHISCVTPDQVWISDYLYNNLLLINTVGDTLHQLTDRCSGWGVYTVDIGGNLIYIDKEYNISKLCENNRRKVKLIKSTNEPWRPRCIYSCPSCGDLLAVMWNIDTKTINVTRYTSIGQHIQTIQQNSRGQDIYSYPKYITENNNGDIVVSDFNNGVVVTEVGGKYRFSYTGPPSKSGLDPLGICTDALSHILVCDGYTRAVHMIDKDGHFLSMLPLTKQQNIHEPWSLCYDKKSHLLWVGSLDGRVNVYRHIERKDKVPDNKNHFY